MLTTFHHQRKQRNGNRKDTSRFTLSGTPSVTASQDKSASSSCLAAITGTGNTSTLPAVKPEENKESILAKLLAKYEEKQQESIVTFIMKLIEQGTAVKLDDFYEPLSKMPDEISKDLFQAIYAVFKENEIKLLGIMRRIV